jgi:FMN-dependent NADH-azoreductase
MADMKRLAFRKSTGKLIPDFQSRATPEGLLSNAVKEGHPPDDVEVREVSDEEFSRLEEQTFSAIRQQRALEEEKLRELGKTAAAKLGLSTAELRALKRYLEEL